MTNDAFFTAIEACKDQFTWMVTEAGQIRGSNHQQHPTTIVCPWTALAMAHGYVIPISEYWRAAWIIGRTACPNADRLASAADWSYHNNDSAISALRARLLTCLGLEEVDGEEMDDDCP